MEITTRNNNQRIQNYELFGPVTNETVLITIQVHNRISYLKHLIESLRVADDISTALLIISHDVYDEALNDKVAKIDFCMVLQIYYPHSIQTHPKTFPGDDPKDCPRDATKLEAKELKCQNYDNPDMYGQFSRKIFSDIFNNIHFPLKGHYREAKYTQMKHHWWWKLNVIFDQLKVTRFYQGFLLLLEEDYFVAQDFIHVFKLMQMQTIKRCTMCNIISLGTYEEVLDKKSFNIIDVDSWTTNLHNMGMAFNRSTWSAIKNCATYFCEYDEYNYDFSLQNVNRKCLDNNLMVALIRGPRVYHIGECGVHHATKHCQADGKINAVKKQLTEAKKKKILFPSVLKRGKTNLDQPWMELVVNGGWGDKRDRSLCLRFTMDASWGNKD